MQQLWAASLVFYFYVYIWCAILRFLINFGSEQLSDRFETAQLRLFLIELIGTIQVCAPIFDVNFVLTEYGLIGVFLQICLLESLNWYTLKEAYGHPCCFVAKELIEGYRDIKWFSLIAGGQIFGAIFSYYLFTLPFWSIGIHASHTEAYTSTETCVTDVTVSVAFGCEIEALGMFLCRYVELSTNDLSKRAHTLINSSFAAFVTIIGIYMTGMYLNPLAASACTFNCEGLSHREHFFVYWLGPFLGWYLAELLHVSITSPVPDKMKIR